MHIPWREILIQCWFDTMLHIQLKSWLAYEWLERIYIQRVVLICFGCDWLNFDGHKISVSQRTTRRTIYRFGQHIKSALYHTQPPRIIPRHEKMQGCVCVCVWKTKQNGQKWCFSRCQKQMLRWYVIVTAKSHFSLLLLLLLALEVANMC